MSASRTPVDDPVPRRDPGAADPDAERSPVVREDGLDPSDWEPLRTIGRRMVDDLVRLHRKIADRPAWQPLSAPVLARLRRPLPAEGAGIAAAYESFLATIEPFALGNRHPRGWGWVNGTGSTVGAFAELLAAGMNTNSWGAQQASTVVEEQVLDWSRRVMGFPSGASGILVSGGSVANLVALAAARDRLAGEDVEGGVRSLPGRPVVYASEQVHNSVDKAVALLGLGRRGLVKVPVGPGYEMDVAALAATIRSDRARGLLPACVVATAGTVNTGAVDPLEPIAELCRDEGIWLHVDGAFGAALALAPALEHRLAGMERADSIAFDFHKWLHVPYGVGCVLIRDPADHQRPFATEAAYLGSLERGITSSGVDFSRLGPELSRPFRALKVWLALEVYGSELFGRLVAQNVRQAAELARLVGEHPRLELAAPVPLNVVCFRYRPGGLPEEASNRLNREVLMRLQESGVAAPSSTLLEGRFVLRVAITNHRTRSVDLARLVAETARIGDEVVATR